MTLCLTEAGNMNQLMCPLVVQLMQLSDYTCPPSSLLNGKRKRPLDHRYDAKTKKHGQRCLPFLLDNTAEMHGMHTHMHFCVRWLCLGSLFSVITELRTTELTEFYGEKETETNHSSTASTTVRLTHKILIKLQEKSNPRGNRGNRAIIEIY